MITYRVEVDEASAHVFRATMTVAQPLPGQRLSLPVWIPGSYMVREFGRHLSRLEARQGRRDVALTQIDKTTWQADTAGQAALVVTYAVYAFDPSVRTAWLDEVRGFFNPTSLCLRAEGREDSPHEVAFGTLPKTWLVATALPPAEGKAGREAERKPQRFRASDYDELTDHPFELGAFWRGHFEAGGVAHEFVVSGAWPGFDGERLLADARRICAAQIAFWHGRRKPPFSRYVFLLNAVEEGYGGLEHRASTALIANRRDLPRQDQPGTPDGYVTLLGLISHEYFHTWNVKRLKPAEFVRYDYTRENYTRLLWFFEGFTSYYDDLFLLRCGLIDPARYLKLIARSLNGLLSTPGRQVQSVAESSFDAWVKYYRTDENTPNSTVSYYVKGAWLALLLDLRLRAAGSTLDELMRGLWRSCKGGAVTEAQIFCEIASLGGDALAAEFAGWVHGRSDPPWRSALAGAGVQVHDESAPLAAALGLRLSEGALTGIQVKSVLSGGAAARAGVSASDELLAVDGWRVRRLDEALQWLKPGEPFDLLLVRQQRVRTVRILPTPAAAASHVVLSPQARPAEAALTLRCGWLGS